MKNSRSLERPQATLDFQRGNTVSSQKGAHENRYLILALYSKYDPVDPSGIPLNKVLNDKRPQMILFHYHETSTI